MPAARIYRNGMRRSAAVFPLALLATLGAVVMAAEVRMVEPTQRKQCYQVRHPTVSTEVTMETQIFSICAPT